MGKTRAPNPSEAEDSETKTQLPYKVKIQSSIKSYLSKAKNFILQQTSSASQYEDLTNFSEISKNINLASTHKDTQSQQWYLNLYQEYKVYLSIDSPFPITFYEHSYFAQFSPTYSLILEQLNTEGYQLIPVPATGPCLFYSLSYLLYQDLSHASSIRLKVVNYIWDNFDHAQISIHGQQVTLKSLYVQEQEEFDSYVDKTFSSSVDSSWLKNHLLNYLTNMSDHLTWGSTLEILAAAHIFTFNFNIWSASNATSTIMCNAIFNNIIQDKPTLNFFYSGNQHYDPLIVWDTNRWTSPCWSPSDLQESQKNVISSNNFMNELQAILLPTYINTDSPQLPLAVDSGHPTVQYDVPFNIDQVLTPHQLRLLENFCTLNFPFEVTVFNTDKDLSIRQHHYKQYQRYVVSFKSLFPVPQDLYQDTFIGRRYSSHLPEVLMLLANLQLRLVPVPGTGPCLFYSISMALYSNLEQADTLRKQAVLYIWNHVYDAFYINNTVTTLKHFFALDQDLQPNHCTPYSEQAFLQNLHGYLKVMTNHLTDGSILELLALALLYRFNFVIWQMPNDYDLDITQPDLYNYSSLFPQQPVINLAFYNNHFDPLFRWSGTAWTQEGRSLLTSTPYQDVMDRIKRNSSDPLTIESSAFVANSDKTTSNIQTNSLNDIVSDVELSMEKCKSSNPSENIGYSVCPIDQQQQSQTSLSCYPEQPSQASAGARGNNSLLQTHLKVFHRQMTLDSVFPCKPNLKKALLRTCRPPELTKLSRHDWQINVGVYNVGGHTKFLSAAQLVPSVFLAKHLDIFLLVDVRVTASNESSIKTRLKETLDADTSVTFFRTTPGHVPNSQIHNDVGGLAIILSPRLSKLVIKRFFDPSDLGLAGAILLQQKGGSKLLIIVTYWPTKTNGDCNNTLWSRANIYLKANHSKATPLQYVQHLVAGWIQIAHQHSWNILLGGDFNAGYGSKEGSHHNLLQWAQALHLTHLLHRSDVHLITRPRSKTTLTEGSMIDHILTSGPFTLVHAEVEESSFARTFSDHLPMIQQFDYHIHAPITTNTPRFIGIELKLRNPAIIKIFQQELKTHAKLPQYATNTREAIMQSAQRIDQIHEEVYSVASNLTNKAVYPKLQFWTPLMMANNYHQQFIITLLKAISKTDRSLLTKRLPLLIANLKTKVLKLNRPGDLNATEIMDVTILNIDQITIDDWPQIINSSHNCKQVLQQHLRVLQTKLQYRTRRLQFALIGKYRLENERLRETGNYKKLLNRIFKKYTQTINEVVLADETIISDPLKIHTHLTKQLQLHHSLNTQRANINWTGLLSGEVRIDTIDSLRHIPPHLLTIFQQSLMKHNTSPLASKMSAILNEPITFEMFQREVMSKAKDKSPGLTGVTINMLKNIPESLLLELYSHINHLWINRLHPMGRVIPESWMHRWISVIPKDKSGPIQLNRIRPISLYEVTRKIWTGILNRRIMNIWEREKVLHSAQYGYRQNRGTETAILQLINIIEDADEFHKPFFLMGFDTKKAFDAVNKQVMKIAWIRLGIPPDIAEYFTELDIEGLTVIKSPHANQVYHSVGKTAVLSESTSDTTAEAYVARDGIGQGDSTSATAWIALYDILLCMLDSNPHQPYMYQVNQQDCALGYSFAFADDLNTISAAKPHLQSAVDVVSAFNAVTGFQSNDKLECGTNSKINVGTVVQYHDHQWKSHDIIVVHKLTIKILGVPIDLTNNWNDLENFIKDRIYQSTFPIKLNNSSCTTKALAYQMALIPSVIYAAKFLNRSISELTKLLNPIQTFLRLTQNLQRSYPNELLYISSTFGGLQLTDITMQIQKSKHRMIKRALASESSAHFAVQSMIARCYRQSIIDPSQPLLFSIYQKSWITSYIEQQGNNNFKLFPTNTSIGPIVNNYASKENLNLVDWLAAQTETDSIRDMLYPSTKQDLLENKNYQIIPNHPLIPFLTLPQPLPLTPPHMLLIGRRYLTMNNKILEFRGKLINSSYKSNLVFRQWIPTTQIAKPKIGSKLKVSHEEMHQSQDILRQLCSRAYCEMTTNQKGYITQSSIAAIIPDNPPKLYDTVPKEQLIVAIPKPRIIVDIFTDASLTYTNGVAEFLFDDNKIESITGSAIMMHNKQVVACISIPIPITYLTFPDSFEAEALTLLIALIHFKEHIQEANIFTDSKSLTETAIKKPESDYLPDHPLVNTIRHVRQQCSLNITWIKSHADNHKKRIDWSYLETGNIAADALTRHDIKTFKQIYPNVSFKKQHKVIEVLSNEIQQMIKQSHKLLVIDHKQRFLPVKHQLKAWKKSQLEFYLNKRTYQSTRKINWKDLTLQFSRRILTNCGFKNIKKSKLIFDKYVNHQYNLDKLTCPFCNNGDDTRAHLLKCTHESLVQLRELTDLQISQLPLPIEYWESSEITQDSGQEIRNLLLQSITIDDRSRLGLFTTSQVKNICDNLKNYQISRLTIKGVKKDLIDLLQLTAKGVDMLIQCRNNKVYKQPKVTNEITEITNQDKSNTVKKNKFQLLEMDDLEEFQIVTSQVLHQFPNELSFIESKTIDELTTEPMVTINGVLGVLYHYTNINSNMVYERFITSTIPSILWPNHSYSTPLQYDSHNKEFSIHLSSPKLGEYIYHERFKNLLKLGFKLIDNNGFNLLFDELNGQAELTAEAKVYTQHFTSIYQNIQTASDLITFLNWNTTSEITKQLDMLFRQLLEKTEASSIVYKTLAAPSKLIMKHNNDHISIVIPIRKKITQKKSEHRDVKGTIQIRDLSNYQLSKERIDNDTLHVKKNHLRQLFQKFNSNKAETKSAQINSDIRDEIIKLKKELKTSNLHVYYKISLKETLNKLHQHVNQQKYVFSQTAQNISTKQTNITKFLQPQGFRFPQVESTHIFNSND